MVWSGGRSREVRKGGCKEGMRREVEEGAKEVQSERLNMTCLLCFVVFLVRLIRRRRRRRRRLQASASKTLPAFPASAYDHQRLADD